MQKPVRTVHMGATKRFLMNIIAAKGAKAVFPSWDGTNDEAIQALRDDPREVFCDCDCEKEEDGSCAGFKPS